MQDGFDGSNWTILKPDDALFLERQGAFYAQGWQDDSIARHNMDLLKQNSLQMQYPWNYSDLHLRITQTIQGALDYGIPAVAIDVETGCYESLADVLASRQAVEEAGLRPLIYTNQGGWLPYTGNSNACADIGLWYASRPPSRPVDFSNFYAFTPFGGWTEKAIEAHQWRGAIAGWPNVDFNVRPEAATLPTPIVPPPAVQPIFIDGLGFHFVDAQGATVGDVKLGAADIKRLLGA